MVKILLSDIRHIRTLLRSLNVHHRQSRSINILGTALKVIAGTPDFNDFEEIKYYQRELLDAADKQRTINTDIQEQINKLTDTINTIIKSESSKIDTGHLYETLLARNRMIISEIETLMLTVTLAKIDIINTAILDSEDINTIVNKHATNTTITDVIEVSHIRALLDNNCLHFLIKYPKPKIECKKLTLLPVQHNNTVLNLFKENTIADCQNQIMAIGNCSVALTSTFCKKIMRSTCAQQLHSGTIAHCGTRPSHLEPIQVIEDGMVIINDQLACIKASEGPERNVKGTYLITFDEEIQINETVYSNPKKMLRKVPGSASSATLNITSHQELLSLPYLHRLNLENVHHIKDINSKLYTGPVISSTFVIIILVTYFGLTKLQQIRIRKRQNHALQATINSYRRAEDDPNLNGGGVNTVTSTIRGEEQAV